MLLTSMINNCASLFESIIKHIRFRYHKRQERRRYGNISLPYKEDLVDKTVLVLGNGPSLKDDMDNIQIKMQSTDSVIFAVNNFAISDNFLTMQPAFYCIADRVYFWENYDSQASSIYCIFNEKVTWNMTLFVPIGRDGFVKEHVINNKITIVPVPVILFEGFNIHKYSYYKKGLAVPSFVNITIMALYLALNMGSKLIYLYGVDHTFLREIAVDDDNVLCSFDKHFYGDRLRKVQPREDGTFMHMADFVYDKYLTFVEHDNIRGYADYLGAEIINCTRCSCIDSYIRLSQIEKRRN